MELLIFKKWEGNEVKGIDKWMVWGVKVKLGKNFFEFKERGEGSV